MRTITCGKNYYCNLLGNIKIIGKSGHGAMPQYAVDPIYVGAKVVDALQSIASRETSPAETIWLRAQISIAGPASPRSTSSSA